MRKIKLISIILAVVLMLGLISGCGVVEVSKFYDTRKVEKSFKQNKAYSTYQRISNESELIGGFGNVLIFKDSYEANYVWTCYDYTKNYVVYSEVYPQSYECAIKYVDCGEHGGVFYTIYTWVDESQIPNYKLIVRDNNGFYIKDYLKHDMATIEKCIPTSNLDLVKINNEFYRIGKDGLYKLVSSFSDASTVPQFTAKNGENYYYINGENILVFDSSLTLKLDFTAPTYADKVNYSIMDNGNVLLQYQYYTSFVEKKYTFVDNNSATPVIMESYILDVDNGELDDVNLDYYVCNVLSRSTIYAKNTNLNFEVIDSDIYNLAVVCEIDDKQIDYTNKLVSLKNNGKLREYVNDLFVGQKPVEIYNNIYYNLPVAVTKNRYVIKNSLNQLLLVDDLGRVIGDITNYDYINNKYIVMDGLIYGFDLKAIADCSQYKIESYYYLQNSFLFSKGEGSLKQYYLFTNNQFVLIADASVDTVTSAYANAILIRNYETGRITAYTENLSVLFTSEADLYLQYVTANGSMVVSGYNSNTQKYETYLIK